MIIKPGHFNMLSAEASDRTTDPLIGRYSFTPHIYYHRFSHLHGKVLCSPKGYHGQDSLINCVNLCVTLHQSSTTRDIVEILKP